MPSRPTARSSRGWRRRWASRPCSAAFASTGAPAVNLARKLGADAEEVLRRCNAKFQRRFRFIEQEIEELGKTPDQSDLAEMDALWNAAKAAEPESKDGA